MSVNRVRLIPTAGKLTDHRSPRALLRSLILGCLVSLVPLGIATPAHAEITQIGAFGNTEPGKLVRAGGVAVDQATNDIYVADIEGDRVIEYNPKGELILMFGKDVDKTTGANICTAEEIKNEGVECQPGEHGTGNGEFGSSEYGPGGVAVDPVTGDVYVDDSANNRVQKFTAGGEYISQIDSATDGNPAFLLGQDDPGIATDSDGNLYLITHTQKGEGWVLKFGPSGKYTGVQYGPTTLGSEELNEPLSVAVDASGFVYVSQNSLASHSNGEVVRFSPEGQALGEIPETYTGKLGVDPRTGDLFVAFPQQNSEHNHQVLEFSSAGSEPPNELLTSFGPIDGPRGVAYDVAEGKLYVSDEHGNLVRVFGTFETPPKLAPALESESTSNLTQAAATLAAKVNPNGDETTYEFQYATSAAELPASAPALSGATTVPGAPPSSAANTFTSQPVSASVALTPDTQYFYRLVATSTFDGGRTVYGPTDSFATPAEPAAVSAGVASNVAYDSALLTGSVTPGSVGVSADTRWCFQYGTSTSYNAGSAPASPADAGQGFAPVPISTELSSLYPGTLYHYRLVALNSLGEGLGAPVCGTPGGIATYGPDQTFATPPTPAPAVATGAASEVSEGGATISGTVNANGIQTTYEFDLGTDTSYGARIFGNAQSATEPEAFSVSLQSLQPGTTYHYRIAATNPYGTTYGADQTFTTPTVPASVITAPPAPPLIATQVVTFPAEVKTPVTKTTKKKQCKKGTALKHGRCVKPKQKAKRKGKR
jgi:DNA-binding beta-propeller fold protein YncE